MKQLETVKNKDFKYLSKKQSYYLYKSEIFTKQKSLVNDRIERVGIISGVA